MRFRKSARLDPSQVEDLRGRGGMRAGGMPMAVGGGGGIIALVIVVGILLLGGSPFGGGGGSLDDLAGQTAGAGAPPAGSPLSDCQTGEDANEREDCRILAVINSVQAYWTGALRGYEPARTRFFEESVSTGCGFATSASGPFYCPADGYVYIDLGFFDQLESEFGSSGGPLAQAYVLAHEYGHHVQDLTGTLERADRDTGPQGGAVRVELQADCYAGVWVANALRTGFIEELTRQDVNDALSAAAAVGDDRIQERVQGRVTPESWTHGSSDQRQSWFSRGIDSGNPNVCDTFRGAV
jgi:predicted metalloprotease